MTTPTAPGWRPIAVAAVRAICLAAASAAIGAATVFVTSTPAKSLAPFAPVLIAGLRLAEGWVDQARGQARQAPGGSEPAEPTAYLTPTAVEMIRVTKGPAAMAAKLDADAQAAFAQMKAEAASPPADPTPVQPSPVAADDASPGPTADASDLPEPAEPPSPEFPQPGQPTVNLLDGETGRP